MSFTPIASSLYHNIPVLLEINCFSSCTKMRPMYRAQKKTLGFNTVLCHVPFIIINSLSSYVSYSDALFCTDSAGPSISGHLYVLTPRGVLNIGWGHKSYTNCITMYEREHLGLQTPQGALSTPLEDTHNRGLRYHLYGCTGSLHKIVTIIIVRGSEACVPILLIQKDSFPRVILYTRRFGQAGLPCKDRNTPRGHPAS